MQALMHIALVLVGLTEVLCEGDQARATHDKGHHHGHHHHHHHHHHHGHHHGANKPTTVVSSPKMPVVHKVNTPPVTNVSKLAVNLKAVANTAKHVPEATEQDVLDKVRALEVKLEKTKRNYTIREGEIMVNGPVPVDFAERFANGVSEATGCLQNTVNVVSETSLTDTPGVVEVAFQAPAHVVEAIEYQAADPDSKLSNGVLRYFLVARRNPGTPDAPEAPMETQPPLPALPPAHLQAAEPLEETPQAAPLPQAPPPMLPIPSGVVPQGSVDIDTAMPYGDLEPFGREDTAQELTEQSVKESDEMVDQLERAEVAEEKRAVFRALTRLRGAAITSFDGVARSQTGNIDEYNKIHKWRNTHPLHHLADEESDVTKWAFPDNADF